MLNIIVIASISYLVGSFPTGVIIGRIIKKKDIRDSGSGNTGATNSFRVLGPLPGTIVAILDFLKGYITGALIADIRVFPSDNIHGTVFFITAVIFVVIGHVKPVFARFKGGMGFNSAAGAITAILPIIAPFCLIVFFISLTLTGHVAITAAITSFFLPIIYTFLTIFSDSISLDPLLLGFFIFIFLLVVFAVKRKIKEYLKGEAVLFKRIMLFK